MRLPMMFRAFAPVLAFLMAVPALGDGVLVFGGTGRLGAETVKQLLQAGERVIVFARPTSDRSRLDGLDVSFVVGDMLNKPDMISAFESVQPRVVIDASALYDAKHEQAVRNLVAAAEITGIEQIIHHGSVGAGDNMALFPEIDFTGLEAILVDKGKAETVLLESGLPYTIIRNGIIEEDDSRSTGMARMTEDRRALGRITRVDLAAVTMDCYAAPRCINRIFHALDDNLAVAIPPERVASP